MEDLTRTDQDFGSKVPWGPLTQAQHGLIDFTGSLLTQQSRVVALDGEESHDS